MEMERINENTIRVLISNDDLDARGITILDLLGDHQQIEDFFYSVLREVDTDHQFADNDSITFQVMPTGNGLELFISKNNADGQVNDENNEEIAHYIKQNLMRTPKVADKAQTTDESAAPATGAAKPANDSASQTAKWQVVAFTSFEDLIAYAHLQTDQELASELYKYTGRYYLALQTVEPVTSDNTVKDTLALAYEYGNPTATSVDFLAEHGKKLMSGTALATIRHYFK
ncbi:MAG: adaptor protein MecA [Limosilactobacillus vaginalis]|uniref:adaptor protein MecA n=1 Tax=Limosilactobacillus vaginalis TaxID=1633 RepID=UPI003EFFD28E